MSSRRRSSSENMFANAQETASVVGRKKVETEERVEERALEVVGAAPEEKGYLRTIGVKEGSAKKEEKVVREETVVKAEPESGDEDILDRLRDNPGKTRPVLRSLYFDGEIAEAVERVREKYNKSFSKTAMILLRFGLEKIGEL